MSKVALVVVDVQNDFITGSLAVPDAVSILQPVKALMALANERSIPIFCTIDSHPANHKSFASNHLDKFPGDITVLHGRDQVLWPDHCVRGTEGERLHPEILDITNNFASIFKGMDPNFDSYSGFFDDGGAPTELVEDINRLNISRIVVCGLATDYCVKATAIDGAKLGLDVNLALDACRGVNINPSDVQWAIEEMVDNNVVIRHSKTFERAF